MPADLDALRALPGIGSYTAAAVASFAFGQRHAVLDTNVRRVLARLVAGQPWPGPLLGGFGGGAAAGRIAAARRARGGGPLVGRGDGTGRAGVHGGQPALRRLPGGARLRLAGRGPPGRGARGDGAARRRTQKYDGTDRQCRGRVLAVLRAAGDPVRRADFDAVWAAQAQLDRALDGLVADGLVDPLPDGRFALPGGAPLLR